jgi:hypothetical protein
MKMMTTFDVEKGLPDAIHGKINQRLCTMSELADGQWVQGNIHDEPPYTPTKGEVQSNTCVDFMPNAKWQDWDWTPAADCHFINSDTPFDRDLYCSLSFNKTLLFMGDSTTFDHFLSLTHLMGIPQVLPRAKKKDALIQSNPCNGTSKLIGKRDFLLHNIRTVMEETDPDIIVLNRGAHFEKDEILINFINMTLIPTIRNWLQKCQDNNRRCHFVWRTTIPGHPNCENFTQPSNSLREMERLILDNPQYQWGHFQYQNLVVQGLLEESSILYDLMDAYHSHILRPDWHHPPNDCLHSVSVLLFCRGCLLTIFTIYLILKYIIYLNFLCSVSQRKTL